MTINQNKVLIIAHYPPPYGGISSHIRDITERISSDNFIINILSFEKKFQHEKLNNFLNLFRVRNKILINLLPSYVVNIKSIIKIFKKLWSIKISVLNFFSALNRSIIVNNYLRKLDINTVAIYGTETGAIIPFLKLLNPNLNICFTFYAAPIKDTNFFLKYKKFWEVVFLQSNKLSSSSKFCAQGANIILKNINVHVIDVIYVGVELDRFPIKDDTFFINKETKNILFVGRMLEEMGVKAVIEIAEKLIRLRDDVVFNIIGATGTLNDLVYNVSKNSKGKIKHKFDVSDKDLNSYMNNCDILIAPTVGSHACMGVSVKEALASGIPVVASNSGGLPEAIQNEVEGFVIPLVEGNIDILAFCEHIEILCNNDVMRLRMGKNARLKAEQKFSNQITEKKVSLFYKF
jgi:glycosyltransferase involved in cell wall biosynthesis